MTTRGFISDGKDNHTMEIPDPIRERLGDEELESAVNLGDEDIICFTPTRTFLYKGEGLISDESLDVFDHDVERLDVSDGRRKSTFTMTYVDSEQRFKVASDRTEPVLERLLTGVLYVADVIEEDETVEGVFRFSELVLIITDARVIKRVGRFVWDEDFEEYPFSNVTGLEFEKGSVATQVVITVDGRPQRIKAPNDEARVVEHTLEQALCSYYDVDSLTALNDHLRASQPETEDTGDGDDGGSSGLELDDSISPLVGDDDEVEPVDESDDLQIDAAGEPTETTPTEQPEAASSDGEATDASAGSERGDTSADTRSQQTSATTDQQSQQSRAAKQRTETAADAGTASQERGSGTAETTQAQTGAVDPEEIDAMKSRLVTLTKVVKRQNELLKQQHETIDQLVEELQQRE